MHQVKPEENSVQPSTKGEAGAEAAKKQPPPAKPARKMMSKIITREELNYTARKNSIAQNSTAR